MAFPSCDIATLNAAVPGDIKSMAPKQLQALLVLYLYRQLHPSSPPHPAINVTALLASAACLDCGPSEQYLMAFEVWLQRQAAIDAGDVVTAWVSPTSGAGAIADVCGLTCLPMHQLRAIELSLRCQLA